MLLSSLFQEHIHGLAASFVAAGAAVLSPIEDWMVKASVSVVSGLITFLLSYFLKKAFDKWFGSK